MKTYTIDYDITMSGCLEVEANTEEEAKQIALKNMNTRPIDEYLDADVYTIETDANGDKIIHVDGYVYQGDDGLMHQQAIGCFVYVSDIQGWDYMRIVDNIHDTFELCDQTVGEISERDALKMYSECERLPFDMIDNNTPDGLYVNLF